MPDNLKANLLYNESVMDTYTDRRFLPLEGVTNFRDAGGYAAADGKTVKWDVLYRSGDLTELTDNDLEFLCRRGLKTVVDFRTASEIKDAPDRLPASVTQVFNLTVDSESVFALSEANYQTGPKLMQKLNVVLVNQAQAQYRRFFEIMSQPQNTPALCHCSAGKDRTGFAVALFLAALGVSYEDIYADYLLSAPLAEAKYAWLLDKYPELQPVITVKREYLGAAFNEIDAVYGGAENYLTRELNVNINLLRKFYTE